MPENYVRKFGAEIEMNPEGLGVSEIMEHLREILGNNNLVSQNEAARCWTVKTDHCGLEVTTPAIQSTRENFNKFYETIRLLKNKIRGLNAINSACGLHTHIEIRDFNVNQIKNLISNFFVYETALLELQPRSRGRGRENTFVYLLSRDSGYIEEWLNNPVISDLPLIDHYSAVNFGRYSNSSRGRKTIEIRYGAGTIRPRKMVNWIQTLLFIVEASKNSCPENLEPKNLNDFLEFVRNTETGNWIDSRRNGLVQWMIRRKEQLDQLDQEQEERRLQREQENAQEEREERA